MRTRGKITPREKGETPLNACLTVDFVAFAQSSLTLGLILP